MPLKKLIACSGIFLFYITALTAQVIPQKNKTITNVVSYHVYQQKLWNMKQLPKNSFFFLHDREYSYRKLLTASSDRSPINISFTKLFPQASELSHLSISEKIQSSLVTLKFQYNSLYDHSGRWELVNESYLESKFLARSRSLLLSIQYDW